jgi:uncharacterized protein
VKKIIRPFAVVLLLIAISGCAYIDSKQGEWIFRPTEATWRGSQQLPANFVEHSIPVGNSGELVHAWFAPVATKDAPVLLYLHGARWNLTGSTSRIPRWNRMGFSVLAIDYRGFGKSSTRSPTEQSANEDAEAAWAYLNKLAPNARKFIFGHSLGGAMATHLATKYSDASGLILEGAFTNIPDMVKTTKFGFLPIAGLVTQRFDNLARISNVRIPVLIAHGTEDNIVPFEMSETLFKAATAQKRLFKAEGGSHHNLTSRFYDAYSDAVLTHFGLNAIASDNHTKPISAGI